MNAFIVPGGGRSGRGGIGQPVPVWCPASVHRYQHSNRRDVSGVRVK